MRYISNFLHSLLLSLYFCRLYITLTATYTELALYSNSLTQTTTAMPYISLI